MSFYQFHYDAAIFNKLPFIGELVAYVYIDSSKKIKKGFLCKVDPVDYVKIANVLKGDNNTTSTIVAKDKVFVLPNCPIPGFKLKEYFKSVGAIQTSTISEATKIIGHDNIECNSSYVNSALIKNITIYYDYAKYINSGTTLYRYTKTPKLSKESIIAAIDSQTLPELEKHPSQTILDHCFNKSIGYAEAEYVNHFYITPTCAMILYYKMLNKIPIIDSKAVFESIQKPLVIDNAVYESLNNMLGSSDSTNHTTAIEIISNCDIDKSLYYLWKLIKDHMSVMENFRKNKNFRLFKEKANYSMLSHKTEKSILAYLDMKNVLTPEIYQTLIVEVIKNYQRSMQSELFDITLTPATKYQKYLLDKELSVFIKAANLD